MARIKKAVTVAMIVVGLVLLWDAVWNTYPRLVPWRLESPVNADTTELLLHAVSHACVLESGEEVRETLDRVEVHETADTVTIETWLGPSERDDFRMDCLKGVGTGFSVRVVLDRPLGNRQFADPACNLDRYAHWFVCRDSSGNRGKFGDRVDSSESEKRPYRPPRKTLSD
ncbi:MAG: hypothetical protein OXS33_01640 [bacterium]|nr:hypothetical protein [bacterium]